MPVGVRHAGLALAVLLVPWGTITGWRGVGAQAPVRPPAPVGERMAPSGSVRLDAGRFTVVAGPADIRLARALLEQAQRQDSFPGLPRPRARVLVAIAPDAARFRQWVGPHAPEWGAAIAFPDQQRIVMQGRYAGSEAGDPRQVLRHELAHLALHEQLGWRAPRWFDEGYASVVAGEWTRETALETAVGMVWRSLPPLDSVEAGFDGGGAAAAWSYALAHRAVAELMALDPARGVGPLVAHWRTEGSLERALRRSYGMTGEGFDRHWRQATRRRYGALALVANVSVAVGGLGVLLGPLFVMRRRRDRRRLAAMRASEASQEAAQRASALEVLLGLPSATSAPAPADAAVPAAAADAAPLSAPPGERYPPG